MEEFPIDFIPANSTEYVYTTHIKDPEHFFVHVESRSKILDDIMDVLAGRYSNLRPSDKLLMNKRLGSLCAAKFTDDNNWYRAKITGIMKTGLIEVQFVDYGNTDYLSDDRIKTLDPDLMHYPVQSYKCKLANVKCLQGFWTPEETIQFEDRTMDQRCQVYFSGKTQDDTYLVEMLDAEGNSLNQMFGAAVGASNGHQTSPCDADAFREVTWGRGSKVPVTVAYIQTPELFWCQDQSYANELLILSEELSRLHMTQSIQPLTNAKPGMICAAKFSEDEAWYRGIIQAVSQRTAQVYFVDYGNTESVPLDLVCKLNPGMTKMPALAAKCSLAGVKSVNGEWDPSIVESLEDLVVDKEFEMTVVDCVNGTFVVNLHDIVENTDVSSQMQCFIRATPSLNTVARQDHNRNSTENTTEQAIDEGPSLSVGCSANAFLSWVDNPGDFWVQLQKYDHLVEKLSGELQDFYAKPQPSATMVEPGAFIVARFSEDGMWYRGLVLKEISASDVFVLFIDYGNSDIVAKSDLRQVASCFVEVDPLAFRCALVGLKPLDGGMAWATDAKSFLEELTADGCTCEVVSEIESRKLVKLIASGKDVARELINLRVVAELSPPKSSSNALYTGNVSVRKHEREFVSVTYVASPQEFYCQLEKNIPSLDGLMEKLELHYSDEGGTPIRDASLGRACIAQYSEDQAWYRGSVKGSSQSGCTIHFVDYGNTEDVPFNLVCEPEPRFLDLPVQAVKCSLALSSSGSHLTDAMSNLVMDKQLTMEVLDVGDNITIVDLYDGATRVSDVLKQSPGSTSSTSSTQKVQQNISIQSAKRISVGTTVTAFTSFVDSPSKFYIQLSSTEEELGTLMDDISVINALADGHRPLTNPQIGQACMALFSEDNLWYRGVITSVQGQSCKVLFIDYGNEESVAIASLRILPSDISKFPTMAYECHLDGLKTTSWSDEAKEFFESVIMDQELYCTFVSDSALNITINGADLKNELVKAGHVKSTPATVSPKSFGDAPIQQMNNGFSSSSKKSESSSFGSSQVKPSFGDTNGGWEDGGTEEKSAGFGSKSRDSQPSSGFGNANSGSSFGGNSVRERKVSTGSSSGSGEFIYPDPPSSSETALLVHMDEDGTFYLQMPSMERDILRLSKRLAGSYKEGKGPRLQCSPAKGVVCAAKFPVDGCMYRAQVIDVDGGNAILRYVDFGNVAECSTRDLKKLFPNLIEEHPVQAFPCKLKGLNWSIDQAEKFASATLDRELEVTFAGSSRPYEVEVKTPDGDLLDILNGKIQVTSKPVVQSEAPKKQSGFGGGSSPKKDSNGGFGSGGGGTGFGGPKSPPKSNGHPISPPAPKVCEQKYKAQAAPQGTLDSYICHIDEEGYFYIQLDRDTVTLNGVMAGLDSLTGEHPGTTVGAACAALFSEDSAWYRAQVSKVEGDNLTVVFVDYGNQDTIKRASVKPLTTELLKNPPLAYKSQFIDVGALSEDGQTKLAEYIMEHKLSVTFTPGSTSPFYVSLVDANGNDLQDVICPSDCYKSQSSPSSVVPAGVSHIEDDGRFYIQLYSDFPSISELQNRVSNVASSTSSSMENVETVEVGQACCHEFESGVWCRCKVVEVIDTKVIVMDVDNGKRKTTDAETLYKLPLELFKLPPFGYECRLKGVESWTDSLLHKFVEMTDAKILNATFHSKESPYRVSLARSIELDLLGLSAPVPDSPVKEKPQAAESIPLKESTDTQAYISHVNDDGTFYVQLVAQEDSLNALSEKLETCMGSSQTCDLEELTVGKSVCAKFTEDDAWYRAVVESVTDDNQQINVRFVDYGNTDTLTADRLAAVPGELETSLIPAFASYSKLAGVDEMTIEQIEKFRECVLDQVVSVEKCDVGMVKVIVSDQLLSDVLGIKIKAVDVTKSAGAEAYISHINDDGTFYIQAVSQEEELNSLQEKLETILPAAETECLELAKPGQFVCAKFTEDDAWYRAVVESVTDDNQQINVRFVDYGNTDTLTADRLAAVPVELEASLIPAFASKSSLAGVDELTTEQIEKFRECVLDQVVSVENCGGEKVMVSISGKPMSDLLGLKIKAINASSGTEAYISHINDDGSFFFQLVTQEEELNILQEKLETVLCTAETGDSKLASPQQLVCAKYSEDDAWYRAIIESMSDDNQQINVRFVDYGNTDTLTVDRLAAVPEECEITLLPAFASKSALAGVDEMTTEQVEKFRESVLDQVVCVEHSGDNKSKVILEGKRIAHILGLDVNDTDVCTSATDIETNDEFEDAPDNIELNKDALLNVNTNAEVDEFQDAVEEISTVTKENVLNTPNDEVVKETELDSEATKPEFESSAICNEEGLKSGSRVSVTVSFVETPYKFYFQLNEGRGRYDELMDQMFEHFSALPEEEGVIEDCVLKDGDLCAALYAEDESWYRARVIEVTDSDYTILFIDHGNSEVVKSDVLRQLPDQFKVLPSAAKVASLAGCKPTGEEWSEDAIAEFQTMVMEKSLLADMMTDGDGHTLLRLLDVGIPINEELIKKGFAAESEDIVNKAIQRVFSDANDTFQESTLDTSCVNLDDEAIVAESVSKLDSAPRPGKAQKIGSVANKVEELKDVSVYVSHVRNPSLFWCQLSTCLDALMEIGNILGEMYADPQAFQLSEPASVGDFVVARQPTDGLLCRSKVLNTTGEGQELKLSLQFVDFGTDGEVSGDDVYAMDTGLCKYPAQAFSCCLDKARPLDLETSWSDEAIEQFSHLVKDQELSLKLVGRDRNSILLVELVDPVSSQSISTILAEKGLGTAIEQESMAKKCPDSSKVGADISTIDGLEITHPILESTAMVVDTTQMVAQPYTIENSSDGHYKTVLLGLHTEYDIVVCNEELPNAFHVRLLELDCQLSALEAEIETYISSESGCDVENFAPDAGDACLVLYNSSWHRALVLKLNEDTLNVKLQDSGVELTNVSQPDVKNMPAHLLELPAQAIPCYLAGVVSVEPEWCSGAIEFFSDFAKDGKFCIYVMEDAHDGKYGVMMNGLDSTETNSVNRALVDLGYADVVPGSNIDVDMEMEKTLDTDMLNELEESFNVVSIRRAEEGDNKETEEMDAAVSGDVPSYCDSYKESEVVRSCKENVDPKMYQLCQISDVGVEQASLKDDEEGQQNLEGNKSSVKHCLTDGRRYSVALDVQRIEKEGCIDIDVERNIDIDDLSVDVSLETTQDASDADIGSRGKSGLSENKEEKNTHHVGPTEGAAVQGKDADGVNIVTKCTHESKSPTEKQKCGDGINSSAPKSKSLYTWKTDSKSNSFNSSNESLNTECSAKAVDESVKAHGDGIAEIGEKHKLIDTADTHFTDSSGRNVEEEKTNICINQQLPDEAGDNIKTVMQKESECVDGYGKESEKEADCLAGEKSQTDNLEDISINTTKDTADSDGVVERKVETGESDFDKSKENVESDKLQTSELDFETESKTKDNHSALDNDSKKENDRSETASVQEIEKDENLETHASLQEIEKDVNIETHASPQEIEKDNVETRNHHEQENQCEETEDDCDIDAFETMHDVEVKEIFLEKKEQEHGKRLIENWKMVNEEIQHLQAARKQEIDEVKISMNHHQDLQISSNDNNVNESDSSPRLVICLDEEPINLCERQSLSSTSSLDGSDESHKSDSQQLKARMKDIDSDEESKLKPVAQAKKRYMSSTPSRDLKIMKAMKKKKQKSPHLFKETEKEALPSRQEEHTESSISVNVDMPLLEQALEQIFHPAEDEIRNAYEGDKSETFANNAVEICDSKVSELGKEEKPKDQTNADENLQLQNVSDISTDGGSAGLSITSSSGTSTDDRSRNEATQFTSCLEIDAEEECCDSSEIVDKTDDQDKNDNSDGYDSNESSKQRAFTHKIDDDDASFDADKVRLSDTMDEFESCSESMYEDAPIAGAALPSRLSAMRQSIAASNTSECSEFGEQTQLDVSSLLLSGSSFDTSNTTDQTDSTIGRSMCSAGDTSTASPCDEDSYLADLMSRVGRRSVSSSSSSTSSSVTSVTSCDTNLQESTCSGGANTSADSSAVSVPKEEILAEKKGSVSEMSYNESQNDCENGNDVDENIEEDRSGFESSFDTVSNVGTRNESEHAQNVGSHCLNVEEGDSFDDAYYEDAETTDGTSATEVSLVGNTTEDTPTVEETNLVVADKSDDSSESKGDDSTEDRGDDSAEGKGDDSAEDNGDDLVEETNDSSESKGDDSAELETDYCTGVKSDDSGEVIDITENLVEEFGENKGKVLESVQDSKVNLEGEKEVEEDSEC